MIPEGTNDRIIHLHYCSGGNSRLVNTILRYDPEMNLLDEKNPVDIREAPFYNYQMLESVLRRARSVSYDNIQELLFKDGIKTISLIDESYPSHLFHMTIPPAVLYCKGRKLPPQSRTLGVVGARKPSGHAEKNMEELLRPAVEKGVVIVSGMAAGIDTLAHRTAIKFGGETAAVLAYGLKHLYPVSSRKLKEELEKDHLVLGEYPPYVKPMKHRFPERNRIISGLSRGVFVVEAKMRSGSLITAETALEQGRDVYALPGRITDHLSAGTNRLIQDGAKPVLSAEDIMEEFGY
ncbi:MAG: DNA-protecting protein DprA [Alkalicoccus sp.]|uniref:DNA-protecting protein DprA n=1 Tax=Alkalicoccus sp. TaxID=2005376 RepID=A0A651DIJ4_9BACI|nr:MAG: DNA-protecting protein DprA [Alkalicoccus sp.]